MKLIPNIFLSALARGLLYVLSTPLILISFLIALSTRSSILYWRLVAIVLDIVGCVIGGPAWNIIFFKRGAKPTVKFGGVITMSFVFAHNCQVERDVFKFWKFKISYPIVTSDSLNTLGIAICAVLEKADPGHLETAKTPSYLLTYHPHWHVEL